MPGIAIRAPMRRPVTEIEYLQAKKALATDPDLLLVIYDTGLVVPFSCFPDCPPCQSLDQTELWEEANL